MMGWTPEDDHRQLECLHIGAAEVRAGDRVVLRPRGRADILDIALAGKIATVDSIEQDFEGRAYLAVTVDDDPGRDLGALRQPGHRFFFSPEEVEPVGKGAMSKLYQLDSTHSHFTVQAFAGGMLSFAAHSPTFAVREYSGSVSFDPSTHVDSRVDLTIRAESLTLVDKVRPADRGEIEERMRHEVLEIAAHPEIRFASEEMAADLVCPHEYHVHVRGQLSLRGVTVPHALYGHLRLYTDGLRLGGETALRLSDYGIRPVTALGGTIKLKDQLQVVFDFVGWAEGEGSVQE